MPLDRAVGTVPIPTLLPELTPPSILGTGVLAKAAFAGSHLEELLQLVHRESEDQAALTFDQGLAMQLAFRREPGLVLQAAALTQSRLFRVKETQGGWPRILAFCATGDLMTNTPLEFLAAGAKAQLDLLFVSPDEPPPLKVPDHDVAFCAVSETAPETLAYLAPWLAAWPRTLLNRPPAAARLKREVVAHLLDGIDGVLAPKADRLDALALTETTDEWFPCLVRPAGTHAGQGLMLATDPSSLTASMKALGAQQYNRTRFVDYRSADGLYRKYRIAIVAGKPQLCHMAVSEHWMVHYLNADMANRPERRAEEARAMETFKSSFSLRHEKPFAAIAERLGLDWVVIDCAETRDGHLLFFEADVAAIVHDMDSPEIYPYKQPAMEQIFQAFREMLIAAS